MPRLTRTQKYADLREQLSNDAEASNMSQKLSEYEQKLKALYEQINNQNNTAQVVENITSGIEDLNREVQSAERLVNETVKPAETVVQETAAEVHADSPAITVIENPVVDLVEDIPVTVTNTDSSALEVSATVEDLSINEEEVTEQLSEAMEDVSVVSTKFDIDAILSGLDLDDDLENELIVEEETEEPVATLVETFETPAVETEELPFEQPVEKEVTAETVEETVEVLEPVKETENRAVVEEYDNSYLDDTLREVNQYNKQTGRQTVDQIPASIIDGLRGVKVPPVTVNETKEEDQTIEVTNLYQFDESKVDEIVSQIEETVEEENNTAEEPEIEVVEEIIYQDVEEGEEGTEEYVEYIEVEEPADETSTEEATETVEEETSDVEETVEVSEEESEVLPFEQPVQAEENEEETLTDKAEETLEVVEDTETDNQETIEYEAPETVEEETVEPEVITYPTIENVVTEDEIAKMDDVEIEPESDKEIAEIESYFIDSFKFDETIDDEEEFSNTVTLEISKIMAEIEGNSQPEVPVIDTKSLISEPVKEVEPVEPVVEEKEELPEYLNTYFEDTEEHPVLALVKEEEDVQSDDDVVEIKNLSEIEKEMTIEKTLDTTIPFVVDNMSDDEEEYEEDTASNKVLNFILGILIIALVAILGIIIYYIIQVRG